ncbi:MAG: hypothetical protein AB7O74_04905 [Candidatus Nanopelagicales bacterium]
MPNPTRRDALRWSAVAAGGALLVPALAACTSGPGDPTPTDPGGPEDPDRGLRAEIGRSESELVALYTAAAAALGASGGAAVATIGERHKAYRQAIDPDDLASLPPSALASASGSASASASPSPTRTAPSLPSSRAGILATLLDAEQAAAAARATQCVQAVDAELARVIALAGAGCAGAAAMLQEVPR